MIGNNNIQNLNGGTAYITPIDTDVLAIDDVTQNITKKITRTALIRSVSQTVVVAASNSKTTTGADYICTGTGDQTTINSAINAVTSNGGTVLLREGTYNLTATITMKSNVRLTGEGWKTIITGTGTNYSLITGLSASIGSPYTDIEFSNFKLDGTGVSSSGAYNTGYKGITMQFIDRITCKNLYIYNCYATGLGIDYLKNAFIYGNYCDSNGRGAVGQETTSAGASGIGIGTGGYIAENVIITGNICSNNGKYGIFIEQQPGSTFAKYQIISNNTCYSNYIGLGARSNAEVIFANNISYSNAQDGIRLDDGASPTTHNNNIQIVNNRLINNTMYGVNLLNTYTHISIKNNDLQGNGTAIHQATLDTSNVIKDNDGYNPVGQSVISVTASPFTYIASNSSEDVYITAGTVSAIAIGTTTILTASPGIVHLEPNQSSVITYTGTPTITKNVY